MPVPTRTKNVDTPCPINVDKLPLPNKHARTSKEIVTRLCTKATMGSPQTVAAQTGDAEDIYPKVHPDKSRLQRTFGIISRRTNRVDA